MNKTDKKLDISSGSDADSKAVAWDGLIRCPYCRTALGLNARSHVIACHLAATVRGEERRDIAAVLNRGLHLQI